MLCEIEAFSFRKKEENNRNGSDNGSRGVAMVVVQFNSSLLRIHSSIFRSCLLRIAMGKLPEAIEGAVISSFCLLYSIYCLYTIMNVVNL